MILHVQRLSVVLGTNVVDLIGSCDVVTHLLLLSEVLGDALDILRSLTLEHVEIELSLVRLPHAFVFLVIDRRPNLLSTHLCFSNCLRLISDQMFVVRVVVHNNLVASFVNLLLVSTGLWSSLARQRVIIVFSRFHIMQLLLTSLFEAGLQNSLLRRVFGRRCFSLTGTQ